VPARLRDGLAAFDEEQIAVRRDCHLQRQRAAIMRSDAATMLRHAKPSGYLRTSGAAVRLGTGGTEGVGDCATGPERGFDPV
jgi:hypothetical protein